MKKNKLPSKSATDFAKGFYLAGNGTINQSAKQACVYDNVFGFWWRIVRMRLLKELEATNEKD